MKAVAGPEIVEARLCYDSAADAVGGTRGLGSQPRILLYKWDSMTVDLLVCDRFAELCALHGQVTASPAGSPIAGADARAGDEQAETDEHGEFMVMLDKEWSPRNVRIQSGAVAVVCPIPA